MVKASGGGTGVVQNDDVGRTLNYSEDDLENNCAGAVKDHVDGGISDLIKGSDHE